MRRAYFVVSMVVLAVMLVVSGCGTATTQNQNVEVKNTSSEGTTDSGSNTSSQTEEKKQVKLGITQIVEHPALDSIREGVLQGLADNGFVAGENLIVDYQNAQGDRNNATTVAQKFAADKVDIIVAITTPSAQAAAQSTKDIPVVFSAVTDPIAAGLVTAFDQTGENITGTSDLVPIAKQVELMQALVPDVKTIGVVYNSGEVNAEVQLKATQEAAAEKGLKVESAGVTSTSEVQQGTASLVGKVDALFILNDNMIVSAFETVLKVAEEANIPIFASDTDTVKRGAVATYGIDQFMIGVQTGEMAAKVLNGESTKNIPVEGIKEVSLSINSEAIEKLGLQLPEELKKEATDVTKEG